MENLHARWVPKLRFQPLDEAGNEVHRRLESDTRYTYFFRNGLGEAAKILECRIGLAASLESIPLETCHSPELLWLLISDELYTSELRTLSGRVILIPRMTPLQSSEALFGFIRFVLELLLAADWSQFPIWQHLEKVLIAEEAYGVAIPSTQPAQALHPAFDGVAVVPRDGQEALPQVMRWTSELMEFDTTATRSLSVWGGHPAEPCMTLHLFPFLWNVQPRRSQASCSDTFCRKRRNTGTLPTTEF